MIGLIARTRQKKGKKMNRLLSYRITARGTKTKAVTCK